MTRLAYRPCPTWDMCVFFDIRQLDVTRIMHEFFVVSGANGCQAWLSAGMSRAGVSPDASSSERRGQPGMAGSCTV